MKWSGKSYQRTRTYFSYTSHLMDSKKNTFYKQREVAHFIKMNTNNKRLFVSYMTQAVFCK